MTALNFYFESLKVLQPNSSILLLIIVKVFIEIHKNIDYFFVSSFRLLIACVEFRKFSFYVKKNSSREFGTNTDH